MKTNTPSHLKARVLAAVAEQPSPTRTQLRRRALALYFAATITSFALFHIIGGLEHSQRRPYGDTLAIVGGAIVLALAVGVIAFYRRPRLAHLQSWWVAFALPVLTMLWLVSWRDAAPSLAPVGVRCFGLTLAFASLLTLPMFLTQRGSVAVAVRSRGAWCGAVGGAWAAVLVDLWCPATTAAHVAVGHVLPLLIVVSVAALGGGAILKIPQQDSGVSHKQSNSVPKGTSA